MRDCRIALVVLALSAPFQVAAQALPVCQSTIGWCEISDPEAEGTICACRDGETVVEGTRAWVETANPFTKLEADQATRMLPQWAMASRSFAGPGQMPPEAFQAYGVVVFKTRASRFDEDRHLLICEAYTSALVHATEMNAPTEEQMVTIWPVSRDAVADEINAVSGDVCPVAVENYGLVHAHNALKILEHYQSPDGGTYDTGGRGPFLIAWTPGSKITEPGTVALMVDMSDVETPEAAAETFTLWRDRIQGDQELWHEDVVETGLIAAIRKFFDSNGEILTAVSAAQ